MPRCPDDKCSGTATESDTSIEWWHCDTCENWFPGAHMRAKGALSSKAPKRTTKLKRKKVAGVKSPAKKPEKVSRPKKVVKRRAKGSVAMPKGLD